MPPTKTKKEKKKRFEFMGLDQKVKKRNTFRKKNPNFKKNHQADLSTD
jgi:hypothetical protein